MRMVILRGLPGSGKSTLAESLARSGATPETAPTWAMGESLSTDDYFVVDGEYRFDPLQLGFAHGWNQARADRALWALRGTEASLVIDNTNIRLWEFRPYVLKADRAGVEVTVIGPDTHPDLFAPWALDPEECFRRNSHGVPLETIRRMASSWEPFVGLDQVRASVNS